MKSKIEIGKLGTLGKVLGNDEFAWVLRELNIIIEKQNEIIDHLNSQDQEEEEVNKMYDFNERKITTYIVDEDKIITILRQDEMPEWLKKGDIRVFKDTPEQTESDVQDWEEEWHSTPVYNQISFIKNLLKEREREVFTKEELECILKWKDACDGEFNCLSLLPSSGEDWGKEEDIESAEEKLRDLLDKLKDKK